MNLIAGLLRPDRGRLDIGGETLLDTAAGRDFAPEDRHVGYVFQDARLFPHLTVAANLDFGLKRSRGRQRVIEYDEVVTLLALAPLLHRRPHSLSGGERQRVGLGRALLAQPRLWLSTASPASMRGRGSAALSRGTAAAPSLPMIYVSHAFERCCATHLVVLETGRVVSRPAHRVSLDPTLTAIVGPAAVGAVLDAEVLERDAASGLTRVRVGRSGELKLRAPDAVPGAHVRVQVLARDVILSDRAPAGLSVRNALRGRVVSIDPQGDEACRTLVDLGGARIVAHVTRDAVAALVLRPGGEVWALVKTVSLRSLPFP